MSAGQPDEVGYSNVTDFQFPGFGAQMDMGASQQIGDMNYNEVQLSPMQMQQMDHLLSSPMGEYRSYEKQRQQQACSYWKGSSGATNQNWKSQIKKVKMESKMSDTRQSEDAESQGPHAKRGYSPLARKIDSRYITSIDSGLPGPDSASLAASRVIGSPPGLTPAVVPMDGMMEQTNKLIREMKAKVDEISGNSENALRLEIENARLKITVQELKEQLKKKNEALAQLLPAGVDIASSHCPSPYPTQSFMDALPGSLYPEDMISNTLTRGGPSTVDLKTDSGLGSLVQTRFGPRHLSQPNIPLQPIGAQQTSKFSFPHLPSPILQTTQPLSSMPYGSCSPTDRRDQSREKLIQEALMGPKMVDARQSEDAKSQGPQPWTVILVDDNAFKPRSKLTEFVQKSLTSLQIEVFKSPMKCWHSIEKKTRLDYHLFVCRAEEAITLARCLITKHPAPSMLVYGGTPLLPFAYQYSEITDLVQRIANWTSVEPVKKYSFDGLNYTVIWVDYQTFQSQGVNRKLVLEVMPGCVGVKTYKSADKCIRAVTNKKRLENVAILVGECNAKKLITYLVNRYENLSIIVESLPDAEDCVPLERFDPEMYPKVELIVTHSWEESHEKLPYFMYKSFKVKAEGQSKAEDYNF